MDKMNKKKKKKNYAVASRVLTLGRISEIPVRKNPADFKNFREISIAIPDRQFRKSTVTQFGVHNYFVFKSA